MGAILALIEVGSYAAVNLSAAAVNVWNLIQSAI